MVHLSRTTDNLHAVKMAVHLAGMMQGMGAEVTLLLDMEGVRLADARQPGDLVWGKEEPISKELAAFVKAGGKMLLCPHCSEQAGITSATFIGSPACLAIRREGSVHGREVDAFGEDREKDRHRRRGRSVGEDDGPAVAGAARGVIRRTGLRVRFPRAT